MTSNISHRTFVQQTMPGSFGLLAGNSLLQTQDGSKQLKEVGLILNVLQKELQADLEGTLRKVAAMGYTNLESNNYYGESAATFKQFSQEVKLKSLCRYRAMSGDMRLF